MSEQGWRHFLAADGVQAYDVASLANAARLAAAVAEVPGLAGSGALLTVTDARLRCGSPGA